MKKRQETEYNLYKDYFFWNTFLYENKHFRTKFHSLTLIQISSFNNAEVKGSCFWVHTLLLSPLSYKNKKQSKTKTEIRHISNVSHFKNEYKSSGMFLKYVFEGFCFVTYLLTFVSTPPPPPPLPPFSPPVEQRVKLKYINCL